MKLQQQDLEIYNEIQSELNRQQNQIELIASENIVSPAVLEAQGSILTNKYAEGYPNRRYYGGCEYIDKIETLAQKRAMQLFNANYVNVQPHSGSQANMAVYMALLKPGDTVLGMSLDAGGHLTHGSHVSFSGKWFNSISYGVNSEGYLDYADLTQKLYEFHPKLLIVGASAYSRAIDFQRIKRILDEYELNQKQKFEEHTRQFLNNKTDSFTEKYNRCYFMVDMAHIAGLIATGLHQNPIPYADVVTTTTHKTLRGPRGGMILTNNKEIAKKINSAIFPGIQGGPLEHIIAAKAVCFKEALQPEYKEYMNQVVKNAKVLANTLKRRGIRLVADGTDNHLVLLDLRELNITGKLVEETLEKAGITCNKNAVPNDSQPVNLTSGIRLGTPAGTSRGFKEHEFEIIADCIADIIYAIKINKIQDAIDDVRPRITRLCLRFPIYENK